MKKDNFMKMLKRLQKLKYIIIVMKQKNYNQFKKIKYLVNKLKMLKNILLNFK